MLGRPPRKRLFFQAANFLVPPLTVGQDITFPGLADNPAQTLYAIRCQPTAGSGVDPILVSWPNFFQAVIEDFSGEGFSCPAAPAPSGENKAYCLVGGLTDLPQQYADQALVNTLRPSLALFKIMVTGPVLPPPAPPPVLAAISHLVLWRLSTLHRRRLRGVGQRRRPSADCRRYHPKSDGTRVPAQERQSDTGKLPLCRRSTNDRSRRAPGRATGHERHLGSGQRGMSAGHAAAMNRAGTQKMQREMDRSIYYDEFSVRIASLIGLAVLCLGAAACGNGSSASALPLPSPTPVPPAIANQDARNVALTIDFLQIDLRAKRRAGTDQSRPAAQKTRLRSGLSIPGSAAQRASGHNVPGSDRQSQPDPLCDSMPACCGIGRGPNSRDLAQCFPGDRRGFCRRALCLPRASGRSRRESGLLRCFGVCRHAAAIRRPGAARRAQPWSAALSNSGGSAASGDGDESFSDTVLRSLPAFHRIGLRRFRQRRQSSANRH